MNGIPRSIAHKTEWRLDLQAARSFVRHLLLDNLLGPTKPQLCVNHRVGSLDPLYEGAGKGIHPEAEFNLLNGIFSGSPFEALIATRPFEIGRVRLMYLESRKSYSFHRDEAERIHFAIETNDQAHLLVEAGGLRLWQVHIPANGDGYQVNTRLTHTAINGGVEPRIHLLVNLR